MARFLLRAGLLITDPTAQPGVIPGGALLIDGARIAETGAFEALRTAHPDLPVRGGPQAIALPGLINAHDHGRGISPLSLGIDDDVLEPWILSLMRLPMLDPGTDTRLSALRQLRSGITTTVNSYYHPGNSADHLAAVRAGYAAAGMRASIVLSAMDRPATVSLLRAVVPDMPPALQAQAQAYLNRRGTPFDMAAWADLLRAAAATPVGLTRMMAGVISAHWSSDAQLKQVADLGRSLGLASQMHLLESPYQGSDRAAFGGPGAMIAHLAGLGALDGTASAAHCTQMDGADIAEMARAGAAVVTNVSSNLRLRSGIAPVRAMIDGGVTVAMGLDSAGINDTTDMFQEMRLAHRLHGTLSAREVLAMATVQGARATAQPDLGTLLPGQQADVVLLDASDIFSPGLMQPEDIFDRLIYWARPDHVRDVFVAGAPVITDGAHAGLTEEALMTDLAAQIPDQPGEHDALLRAVAPYMRRAATG